MDVARLLKMVVALNSHIQNSLVKKGSQLNEKGTDLAVAEYIEKSADSIGAKMRLARLVDGHVGHIVSLINNNEINKAKEYLDVIRPQGWEQNAERNIDKLFELVVRGLAEKLESEAFQALGL